MKRFTLPSLALVSLLSLPTFSFTERPDIYVDNVTNHSKKYKKQKKEKTIPEIDQGTFALPKREKQSKKETKPSSILRDVGIKH